MATKLVWKVPIGMLLKNVTKVVFGREFLNTLITICLI